MLTLGKARQGGLARQRWRSGDGKVRKRWQLGNGKAG